MRRVKSTVEPLFMVPTIAELTKAVVASVKLRVTEKRVSVEVIPKIDVVDCVKNVPPLFRSTTFTFTAVTPLKEPETSATYAELVHVWPDRAAIWFPASKPNPGLIAEPDEFVPLILTST